MQHPLRNSRIQPHGGTNEIMQEVISRSPGLNKAQPQKQREHATRDSGCDHTQGGEPFRLHFFEPGFQFAQHA